MKIDTEVPAATIGDTRGGRHPVISPFVSDNDGLTSGGVTMNDRDEIRRSLGVGSRNYQRVPAIKVEAPSLPGSLSTQNRQGQVLEPPLDFVSVTSVVERKGFPFRSGERADSLEMRILAQGHAITLIGPRGVNIEQFLYNVAVGIHPYLGSPLLKELNAIVIDPGELCFTKQMKGGRSTRANSAALALAGEGAIIFSRQGKFFTPAVFHHEMGHLIADKLRKAEAEAKVQQNWNQEGVDPGQRYTNLWRVQGSHSDYGKLSAEEGFAEAWAEYMTNNGKRLTREVLALLATLNISNKHSSSPEAGMQALDSGTRSEPLCAATGTIR